MKIYSGQVTSKGQVTIPAELRRQFGIVEGSRVRFVVVGDEIRITNDLALVDRAYGALREFATVPPMPDDTMRDRVAKAIGTEQFVAQDIPE